MIREMFDTGVQQLIEGNNTEQELTREVIRLSNEYYLSKVANNSEKTDIKDTCVNKHELCSFWAAYDRCDIQYEFMEAECSLACRSCEKNIHEDFDSAGVEQVVGNDVTEVRKTREVIRLSKEYYLREIANNPQTKAIFEDMCVNKHELCSFWAAQNQCDIQYEYMQSNCALACKKCSFFKKWMIL